MPDPNLRLLTRSDFSELSDLICASLNHWHQTHGRPPIFPDPESCTYMPEIYEALDPDCCIVATRPSTNRLMGACFWHPRPTHVSVGIMAVHPNYTGHGVASRLLKYITDIADAANLPTRLVSSAINLDSFSLYNRAGFVPVETYQDMILDVPDQGLPSLSPSPGTPGEGRGEGPPQRGTRNSERGTPFELRDATPADLPAIESLEHEVSSIRRPKDYSFILNNTVGDWTLSVATHNNQLQGFLATLRSARGATLGPGLARTESAALSLLHRELSRARGLRTLTLIPCRYQTLVRAMYQWGAKNVEIHLAQVRGKYNPHQGPTFPTFMPESA